MQSRDYVKLLTSINFSNLVSAAKCFALFTFIFLIDAPFKATHANKRFLKESHVEGKIYYDANQNGLLESDEHGVGGVELQLGDNKTTSDERGLYRIQQQTKRKQFFLKMRKNSLPAGSIITTPSLYPLHQESYIYEQKNFGLIFPFQSHEFVFSSPLNSMTLHIPNSVRIKLAIKEEGLFVNNKLWKKFPYDQQTAEKLETTFVYSSIPDEWSIYSNKVKEMVDTIKTYPNKRLKVKIYSKYHDPLLPELSAKKSRLEAKRLGMFLIERGIPKQQIFYDSAASNKETQISVKLLSIEDQTIRQNLSLYKCELLRNGNSLRTLSLDFPLSLEINPYKENTFYINCPKKRYLLKFPQLQFEGLNIGKNQVESFVDQGVLHLPVETSVGTSISWDETTLVQPKKIEIPIQVLQKKIKLKVANTTGAFYKLPIRVSLSKNEGSSKKIILNAPKFLRESRDLSQTFFFQTRNVEDFYVNGRKFSGGLNVPYKFESKRGHNEIQVFLDDQNRKQLKKFPFYIAFDPRYRLNALWSLHQIQNTTTFQKTKYELDNVRKIQLEASYFHFHDFGIEMSYRTDLIPSSLNHFSENKSVQTRHNTFEARLIKRVWANRENYESLRVTFGAGFMRKSFQPEQRTRELTPENLNALSLSAKLSIKEYLIREVSLATKLTFSPSLKFDGSFSTKLTQEVRYNLNDLGAPFVEDSYYSFYERNGAFQYFDLILRGGYELYRNNIDRLPKGRIDESSPFLSIGLGFSY